MKEIPGIQEFLVTYQSSSHMLGISYRIDSKTAERHVESQSGLIELTESRRSGPVELWKSVDAMQEFVSFYEHCDGAELFKISASSSRHPLIRIASAGELDAMTRKYREGGRWFGFTRIGKAKEFFSQSDSWFVFGEVCGGPACLLSFVEGENAGKIFYFEPQPRFNIYKPIAPSLGEFLHRLCVDPAGRLRTYGAHVSLRKEDGQQYGYRILTIERA